MTTQENQGIRILRMLREKGLEFEVSKGVLNVGVKEDEYLIYPEFESKFSSFVLSGVWMITDLNRQGKSYVGKDLKVEVYETKVGVWDDYTFYPVDFK